MRKGWMGAVLALTLLTVLGAGGYFLYQHHQDTQEAEARSLAASQISAMQDVLRRFRDANQVAGATGRIALSGPVANLQSVRRDADALPMPACAGESKQHLLTGMDKTVEGYITFMRNEWDVDSKTRELQEAAAKEFEAATEGIRACG